MDDIQEEIGNKVGVTLSSFLSDFAPRPIADENIEIFPADELQQTECFEPSADFSTDDDQQMSSLDAHPSLDERLAELEAAKQQAIEDAIEQTKIAMEEKFQAEKQALQENHEKELAAVKQNTIDEIASQLDTNLKNGLATVLETVGNDVAKILATFLGDKLRADALNEFAERIANEALFANKTLVIEGNPKLLTALENQKGFDKTRFDMQPVDTAEIRLRLSDAVIATRLEPLISALKELVK